MSLWTSGTKITADLLNSMIPQIGTSAGQTIGSTTPVAVTGLDADLVSGATYVAEGLIEALIGGTPTSPKIGFYGTASVSAMLIAYSMFIESVSGENIYGGSLTALSTNSAQTAGFGAGDNVQVRFCGTLTCSVSGTLTLDAGLTTSGDGWTVQAGSYMKVIQQLT